MAFQPLLVFAALGIALGARIQSHDTSLGDSLKPIKVRLYWIRHGLSCANVMDRCVVKPPEANSLLADIAKALPSYPEEHIRNATLSLAYGVSPATESEKDCSVELEGAGLTPGERGDQGAVIRVHDLYRDPALSDCSRLQSIQAGKAFLKHLQAKGQRLDFVGSSFLLRAFETAYAMMLASEVPGVLMEEKVTPVPYMTERAPHDITAAQADNLPREVKEQRRMIEEIYQKSLPADCAYAETWPRFAQQWEKFKAFLAAELLPKLRPSAGLQPGGVALRDALEAGLPENMEWQQRGKEPISLSWQGGAYATGATFQKEEYVALDAQEVNLAIVGHSQMMLEYCQDGESPKPNNNAILEKLFIVQPHADGKASMQELAGKCARVMDAPKGSDSLSSLVKADVATCQDPYDVSKFIGLPEGGKLEESACVKLASADAYPMFQ